MKKQEEIEQEETTMIQETKMKQEGSKLIGELMRMQGEPVLIIL